VWLHTRRWFCDTPCCPRRIFTERLPTVAAPFSQRTTRLATIVPIFGVAVGGAPGARLRAALGIPISGATLLRTVMATALPDAGAPHVLGVDDWCRRKGRTYGTILVDMEQHRPLDLLLGRDAAPFAQWRGDHPDVEVIGRDRAGAYADGARQGAPNAVQVADRWHLLKNLGETLERLLQRHHPALTETAHTLTQQGRAAALAEIETSCSDPFPAQAPPEEAPLPCLNRMQQDQRHRRERRLARYEAVRDLHRQGLGVRAIARQLHIGRRVVRQYLAAPSFPERLPNRPRQTLLTPYEPYLRMRWEAGCQNAAALWRDLRAQGFTGTESFVRQQVRHWRVTPGQPGRPARTNRGTEHGRSALPPPVRAVSPRQAVWLFLRDESDLTSAQRAYRAELLQCCPDIVTALPLVEEFQRVVRSRDQPAMTAWLIAAETSALREFRDFAAGLRRDSAAVEAAVSSAWSSGQVEGQVTRLKLVKRSRYGRAGFPLLRQRYLLAGRR
jgi:transposase